MATTNVFSGQPSPTESAAPPCGGCFRLDCPDCNPAARPGPAPAARGPARPADPPTGPTAAATPPPTVRDILGPGGAIARRLPGYEARPQQLAMAEAVAHALAARSHLVVEAGTGVGKSLAYAVPAILAAVSSGETVVISTHTKALQAQLLEDLASLQGVLPHPFRFALVKGRGNYLSKRRLGVAIAASQDVFPDFVQDDVAEQLTKIATWSVGDDHDGSRDQLEFPPSPDVWNEVMSDDDHCLGKNCATHKECFYYASRRKMKGAHVLVVNHSLYMTYVNLARQGVEILPEHAMLVIDEAHTLEAVASAHLGETVSNVQVMRLLNRVHHERTGKGILRGARGEKRGAADDAWLGQAVATVNRARNAADVFFGGAKAFMDKRERDVVRFRDAPHPEEWKASGTFIEAMKVLTTELNSVAARLRERQRKAKINREVVAAQRFEVAAMDAEAVAKSCCNLTATIHVWLKQLEPDSVYWITQETKKGLVITLTYAPLHLGPVLKQHLWDKVPTCILTSATLAVGTPANFDHVRDRLGLADEAVATLAVGSPFDYATNVTLFLNRDLPDPGDPSRRVDNAFERQAIRSLPRHLWKTQGNAFVLFTSNVMMREAERVLRSWIEARGWPLLIQGDLPPAKLIERFKAGGSVLFGVDSFWTGVDVRGPALSNVVITKLPFPRPGQPLLDARMEDFQARGGDPFSGYLVPEAIIKLKQGFGRLIRSQTDSGIAVILDPRLLTKPYGRTFLSSLPACPRVVEDLRPAPSVEIAD